MVLVSVGLFLLAVSLVFSIVLFCMSLSKIKIGGTINVNIPQNGYHKFAGVDPAQGKDRSEMTMVEHPGPDGSTISYPTAVPDMSILDSAKVETNMDSETLIIKGNTKGSDIKSAAAELKKTKSSKGLK